MHLVGPQAILAGLLGPPQDTQRPVGIGCQVLVQNSVILLHSGPIRANLILKMA